jgi:hypothetical protein
MKSFFLGALALFSLTIVTNGCKDDFDPSGDFEEVPIVYGLLNQQDTAHYIRIERAFLEKATSALTLARDTNSLYFKNLNVTLEQLGNVGQTVATFPLARVNGALEGYPRESGIFNNNPNILYKTKAKLFGTTKYRLTLVTKENKSYTAETTTLEDLRWGNPNSGNPIDFRPDPTRPTNINWTIPSVTNVALYDVSIRVLIPEKDAFGVQKMQAYTWKAATNVSSRNQDYAGNSVQLKLDGLAFYKKLRALIPNNPNIVERCSRGVRVEFVVTGVGKEIDDYIKSSNSGASGIASTEPTPKYTNITNGKGVLSSTFTHPNSESFPLSKNTIDEFTLGTIMAGLNFTPYSNDSCF